jgi:hypothetical protein
MQARRSSRSSSRFRKRAWMTCRPGWRVFYTLSAWQNRDALYAFARTQPHRSIMARLRPTMRSATFTFWDVPTGKLPLTWDDAQRRLAEQARAEAAVQATPLAPDWQPHTRDDNVVGYEPGAGMAG